MFKRYLVVGLIFILMFILVPGHAPVNAVAASADGWTRLSNPIAVGGSISNLVAAPSNPDILYALNGSLISSQDGGATWQDLPNQSHYFTSLAVDPENSDTLYATGNNQLWKSTDAGLNWAVLYPFGETVVVPAPGLIYVAGMGSYPNVFARSLDGGATWERSSFASGRTYSPIDQIFVSPVDPNRIFVGSYSQSSERAQYSLNGGLTWQELQIDGLTQLAYDMAFDPQNKNRFYLDNSGMRTTDDNGVTWSECGTFVHNGPLRLLAVDDLVYAIPQYWVARYQIPIEPYPTESVYMSSDHCATWWQSIQGIPAPVNSLIGDPRTPGRLLAATGGLGILISGNGGTSWQESNTGLTSPAVISKLAVAPSDPNVILAGSKYPRPGVYRSTDGGLTWSPSLLDIEPLSMLIHPQDPLKSWIGSRDWIYYSEDGAHWSHESYSTQINDLDVSPTSPDSPYAATFNNGNLGRVFQFFDGANDWLIFPVADLKNVQTLAVNPLDANDILVGGEKELPLYSIGPWDIAFYRTQDGGHTWHQVFSSSTAPVVDIAIDPHNPQNRYLLLESGYREVYLSTDSGETWSEWSDKTYKNVNSSSSLLVDDFGGVYIFTQDKIYYRTGYDSDWQIVTQNFQYSTAGALWRGDAPFLLSAGTDGLWKKDLPPIHKTWLPALSK